MSATDAIQAIKEGLNDPAIKRTEYMNLECATADWRALLKSYRAMQAALRKIKRIREAEDEAGEIARAALKVDQ